MRNGGALLAGVLDALSRQTVAHQLLICDSGSQDGSPELARTHGARVIEISPQRFSHGGVRNLLMREAKGRHVALLTQDAEPREPQWLERLLGGFELAEDVAIVYGPYEPRADAPVAVQLELRRWFASLAPDGSPRIDRLAAGERDLPAQQLLGERGFLTDANACVSRVAWERVPFREVPYAEDRVLALDMLRAGYAKAFLPSAAVLHSHAYSASEQLRRCFDEWRSLLEVYGWREPLGAAHLARQLRGELGQAWRTLSEAGVSPAKRSLLLVTVARHHILRLAGAALGSRADRMPPGLRGMLSLEHRPSFQPLQIDEQPR